MKSLQEKVQESFHVLGYSVALDIYGRVYSWGASACGQLGISSIKDLPTDLEGFPYQPIPTIVDSLAHVRVVQIATGDAHCVARSAEGRLYSWGGGGCGQLGHPDTHLMPKDEDGCAYMPKPKFIESLKECVVREVSPCTPEDVDRRWKGPHCWHP